jgi:hypothetical protein
MRSFTGGWAEKVIAFDWAYRLRRQYALQDFERFERWLETYVNGWGSCDDLCTHALGEHLRRFPESLDCRSQPLAEARCAGGADPIAQKSEHITAALHMVELAAG